MAATSPSSRRSPWRCHARAWRAPVRSAADAPQERRGQQERRARVDPDQRRCRRTRGRARRTAGLSSSVPRRARRGGDGRTDRGAGPAHRRRMPRRRARRRRTEPRRRRAFRRDQACARRQNATGVFAEESRPRGAAARVRPASASRRSRGTARRTVKASLAPSPSRTEERRSSAVNERRPAGTTPRRSRSARTGPSVARRPAERHPDDVRERSRSTQDRVQRRAARARGPRDGAPCGLARRHEGGGRAAEKQRFGCTIQSSPASAPAAMAVVGAACARSVGQPRRRSKPVTNGAGERRRDRARERVGAVDDGDRQRAAAVVEREGADRDEAQPVADEGDGAARTEAIRKALGSWRRRGMPGRCAAAGVASPGWPTHWRRANRPAAPLRTPESNYGAGLHQPRHAHRVARLVPGLNTCASTPSTAPLSEMRYRLNPRHPPVVVVVQRGASWPRRRAGLPRRRGEGRRSMRR